MLPQQVGFLSPGRGIEITLGAKETRVGTKLTRNNLEVDRQMTAGGLRYAVAMNSARRRAASLFEDFAEFTDFE